MSRIGTKPVTVPGNVEVKIENNFISVKGPKGALSRQFHKDVIFERNDGEILVKRPSENKEHRSLHGLSRSLLANMVEGVTNGYTKVLEINGVGYKAQLQGEKLVLAMGYSHPVEFDDIDGISFEVENNKVKVMGIDKEKVGQIAAVVRGVRPVEPYKGKGIRYEGERVIRKAGKAGKK